MLFTVHQVNYILPGVQQAQEKQQPYKTDSIQERLTENVEAARCSNFSNTTNILRTANNNKPHN
jgi:hypothetical protein